jgi:hypothetical protein
MRKRNREASEQPRIKPPVTRPPVPAGFRCHICEGLHWTVACPRVLLRPSKYPSVDIRHGCEQCGQRGHLSAKCTVKKFKCSECGALHDTEECPYSYKPIEWHQFFDASRQRLFYVKAEDSAQQGVWAAPKRLDVIFWHCDACLLLIPDAVAECVGCHAARPQNMIKLPPQPAERSTVDADKAPTPEEVSENPEKTHSVLENDGTVSSEQ